MTQEEWDEFRKDFNARKKEGGAKVYGETEKSKEIRLFEVEGICGAGVTVRLGDFETPHWGFLKFSQLRTEEDYFRKREEKRIRGSLKKRKCVICGKEYETTRTRTTCDSPECKTALKRLSSKKGREKGQKGWEKGIRLAGSTPKKEKKSEEEKK